MAVFLSAFELRNRGATARDLDAALQSLVYKRVRKVHLVEPRLVRCAEMRASNTTVAHLLDVEEIRRCRCSDRRLASNLPSTVWQWGHA
jgi:hypothetical protein